MPRFPVPFVKRRSTLNPDELHDASVAASGQSSFRVLDRSEVEARRSSDGAAGSRRLSRPMTAVPLQTYPRSKEQQPQQQQPQHQHQPTRTMLSDVSDEDNMFAGLKPNRYVP